MPWRPAYAQGDLRHLREPPATLLPEGFLPPKSVLTVHLNPCLQPLREPPALSKNNQLPLSLSLTTQNSQLLSTPPTYHQPFTGSRGLVPLQGRSRRGRSRPPCLSSLLLYT
ncbi:hypothetical protein MBAV_002209 [Candidatus Magnetobacterium bavaricum]|uniref:Uncharacterized protein n=1 Tax=Candidatus Magnetobacterium bavaricum TaxID=29290 RepID=A0A0F3GUR9_9BACT|nr:hypothetical protein MBAV_002209 [Candidatus Magnetobacterium bavaricum]